MQDTAIIFNPKARSEKSRDLASLLREVAPEARLLMTTGPGDARRLAAEAAHDGFRIVAAAGGDGTVNEVANGLAGTDTALGVLPIGTMNVFSKEHNLPDKLEDAWAVIRAGSQRQIDLLAANDTHLSSSPAWGSTRRW